MLVEHLINYIINIIAIFVSLAEVAGVVMITKVPLEIQTIFIWLVMIFPIILVSLFFLVFYKKTMNFYSPDCYKNEDNFVKIISDLYDNVISGWCFQTYFISH